MSRKTSIRYLNKMAALAALGLGLLSSCGQQSQHKVIVLVHSEAPEIVLGTATDLKNDLEKVLALNVPMATEKDSLPPNATLFVVGTLEALPLAPQWSAAQALHLDMKNPGTIGGIWYKKALAEGKEAIVLAGSDVQGLQDAVYDYAKEVLHIDPLAYWTGKQAQKMEREKLFAFQNRKIAPPKVPLRCYFENDVDELANYRGKLLEYDWESYTEMINSLVRLRYNAIQLFDMLGRPEFFLRPEYKALSPNYKVDLVYLEKMINYAQSKGMKVAIDFALGYQIQPMSADKATCWEQYKEDWIASWRYYLEETPLKKTDIFMLRPRHQVWDWEYESSCGEDKITVFNEVYKVFGALVDQYKPNAQKVLICYADGMQMWNEGFRPPKDWIVAWSDDGFGDFEHLPQTTDGYHFGTYMHAGFWLNHTVHHPYPVRVEEKMKAMFQTYGASAFCLVNGQNFRPFLLNIEAYATVCRDAHSFEGEQFYKDWTQRYFQADAANHAVASMKLLSLAQEGHVGYVQHLWEIREAVSYLSDAPIERPGKTPVPSDYERVQNDIAPVAQTAAYIQKSLAEAEKGLRWDTSPFYHDYVYLPVQLYHDLMAFEQTLHAMAQLKRKAEVERDPQFVEDALELIPQASATIGNASQKQGRRRSEPKVARLVRSKHTAAQQRFSR
jgi:hypothetical protein